MLTLRDMGRELVADTSGLLLIHVVLFYEISIELSNLISNSYNEPESLRYVQFRARLNALSMYSSLGPNSHSPHHNLTQKIINTIPQVTTLTLSCNPHPKVTS